MRSRWWYIAIGVAALSALILGQRLGVSARTLLMFPNRAAMPDLAEPQRREIYQHVLDTVQRESRDMGVPAPFERCTWAVPESNHFHVTVPYVFADLNGVTTRYEVVATGKQPADGGIYVNPLLVRKVGEDFLKALQPVR
jgi:hypothetical protein